MANTGWIARSRISRTKPKEKLKASVAKELSKKRVKVIRGFKKYRDVPLLKAADYVAEVKLVKSTASEISDDPSDPTTAIVKPISNSEC
jgi:hypothetical protein